jgi:hypothetical protein
MVFATVEVLLRGCTLYGAPTMQVANVPRSREDSSSAVFMVACPLSLLVVLRGQAASLAYGGLDA